MCILHVWMGCVCSITCMDGMCVQYFMYGWDVCAVLHVFPFPHQSGFELRYERQKEIASDEVIPDRAAKPFMLTPVLVRVCQDTSCLFVVVVVIHFNDLIICCELFNRG